MNRFEKHVVLITGGSSGIGFATARAFLEEGAKVAVTGRNAARLGRAVRRLGSPGRIMGLRGDVSKAADARRFSGRTDKTIGPLHVLGNNAGIYVEQTSAELTERYCDWILDININGPVLGTKYGLTRRI